jgi:hypothetical protein
MSRAIHTDGIGTTTTSHLNLTRSLADVWGIKVVPEPVVRLEAPDGRWLHREGNRLTLVRADAWSGRKSEGEALANKVGQGLKVK